MTVKNGLAYAKERYLA